MIKVQYQEPELKEVIESIIGRSFFIFIQQIITDTIVRLDMPARLMNDITVLAVPHDKGDLGVSQTTKEPDKRPKGTIVMKIQETPEEMDITLRHEVIHLLKPDWDEKKVIIQSRLFYTTNHYVREFTI